MNGNLMDTNVVVRILNGDTNLVQQLKQYNNLCSSSVVLGELLYGAAKSARSAGNVMPENDMWIAATAIANDMAVITQDKHFEHIPGLTVIKL
mgnify:CR=1 FL=1